MVQVRTIIKAGSVWSEVRWYHANGEAGDVYTYNTRAEAEERAEALARWMDVPLYADSH